MAISVLIGMIVAFGGLVAGYTLENGSLSSLALPSPFLIVFFGTWGAVLASFGIANTVAAFKDFFVSLSKKNQPDPEELIQQLGEIAEQCRRDGILSLQKNLSDPILSSDKYLLLKEGIIIMMDMKDSEQMEDVLTSDIDAYTARRQSHIDVFQGAAGFSPTLGIIGTVMGLVQVLASGMENAEALTAAISVAFIATLYGVVFANLIYLPMANQLKTDLKLQKIFKQMIIEGVLLIANGESSRNMENKLALYYQAFPKGQEKYKRGINN